MEVITKNAFQTQKLGEKIGSSLKPRTIVALYGDLGSGKTTFVQGLARSLGIKRRINSPTFILIREYKIYPREITFYHIDLYRTEKFADTKSLGLKEIFSDQKGIVVIEWAEKIKKILPKKRIDIRFHYFNHNQRRITIK